MSRCACVQQEHAYGSLFVLSCVPVTNVHVHVAAQPVKLKQNYIYDCTCMCVKTIFELSRNFDLAAIHTCSIPVVEIHCYVLQM